MKNSTPPRYPDLCIEVELQQRGFTIIAGIDEAGRGSWAGPVAAAAVILPSANENTLTALAGVRDSKQMTSRQRDLWVDKIKLFALGFGIGMVSAEEIDRIGLIPATYAAMRMAILALDKTPDHLLIDYLHLPEVSTPQTAVTHGDARCLSIAAASVLAKTARDTIMIDMDNRFPGFGFARNKGYGTREHQHCLQLLGPCDAHRRSFRPVANFFQSKLIQPDHPNRPGRKAD